MGREKYPQQWSSRFYIKPTEELINHGWEIGCVGVEIQSSYTIENKPGRATRHQAVTQPERCRLC